jgi:hypothetical protein
MFPHMHVRLTSTLSFVTLELVRFKCSNFMGGLQDERMMTWKGRWIGSCRFLVNSQQIQSCVTMS